MNPRSAIQKGKELENFVVERLRTSGLDTRAQRNPGSGNGLQKGDIWNDLNICFECKNTARPNLNESLKQVNRESLGTQNPVMVWHMPHTPLADSQVIVPWHYFEELLLKVRNGTPAFQNPDRTLIWKISQLKKFANEVIKEIET